MSLKIAEECIGTVCHRFIDAECPSCKRTIWINTYQRKSPYCVECASALGLLINIVDNDIDSRILYHTSHKVI